MDSAPPPKLTHFTSRFPEGHAGIVGFSLPSAGKSKVIIYVKFLQSLWLFSLGSLWSMLFNHPWVGSNHFEFPPFVHSLSKWGSLESKLFTDAFVIFSSLMSSNKPLSELLGNLRCSSGSKLSQTFKNFQISCQFQRNTFFCQEHICCIFLILWDTEL